MNGFQQVAKVSRTSPILSYYTQECHRTQEDSKLRMSILKSIRQVHSGYKLLLISLLEMGEKVFLQLSASPKIFDITGFHS